VKEVFARVLRTSEITNGPDTLLMQVRMQDGAVGQCFFCYTVKERRESPLDFSIFGTSGVLRIADGSITVTHGVGQRATASKTDEGKAVYARQWNNFCAAIRGEEPVLSTAWEAYKDLQVIDAALRSSENGYAVQIPS
jgi:predicted dehydrogenase